MKTPLEAIETNVGWALFGDNLYRGRSLNDSVVHDNYWNLLATSIGGPALGDRECSLLDAMCAGLMVADPRIWPLKITWLCASYGGKASAVAAAQVYLEDANIGPPAIANAASTLVEVKGLWEGATQPQLALREWWRGQQQKKIRLAGFGVAGRNADERVPLLWASMERFGVPLGPYGQMQQRLALVALEESGLAENGAGPYAAVLLDMGFDAEQVFVLMHMMLVLTLWASAQDAARLRPGQLQQLPEPLVHYRGPALRRSPRALQADIAPVSPFGMGSLPAATSHSNPLCSNSLPGEPAPEETVLWRPANDGPEPEESAVWRASGAGPALQQSAVSDCGVPDSAEATQSSQTVQQNHPAEAATNTRSRR